MRSAGPLLELEDAEKWEGDYQKELKDLLQHMEQTYGASYLNKQPTREELESVYITYGDACFAGCMEEI